MIDIAADSGKDSALPDGLAAFQAVNLTSGQMLRGLEADTGVATPGGATLATFTFEATRDAAGSFVVDLTVGPHAQTYLVAPGNGRITFDTTPAIVTVKREPRQR